MIWKALAGLIWVWGIAALRSPAVPLSAWAVPILAVVLGVHVLECVVFLPRFRAAGGHLANHVAQTLLFGVAHVRTTPPLPRAAA